MRDTQRETLKERHSKRDTQRETFKERHSKRDTRGETLKERHSKRDAQRETLKEGLRVFCQPKQYFYPTGTPLVKNPEGFSSTKTVAPKPSGFSTTKTKFFIIQNRVFHNPRIFHQPKHSFSAPTRTRSQTKRRTTETKRVVKYFETSTEESKCRKQSKQVSK